MLVVSTTSTPDGEDDTSTMAFYDKWFGRGRTIAQARDAELRGDLEKATSLFGKAGDDVEVARVMVLRGDSEPDARARLQWYTQAARIAVDGTETNKVARRKRAELLLALAGDASVSALARHQLREAAMDLEAIGEPLQAADAYARAGDKEGEAHALEAAGDLERLEFLLATEQHSERTSRARDERAKNVDFMIECGKRREALAALEDAITTSPDDAPLRERANGLRARRVLAPVVTIEALGNESSLFERYVLVTGDEVVIGRAACAITVASNAVSRQHLRIGRDAKGELVVRDLDTRNGTQLRGINLAGPLPIGDGLELKLGKEVPLRITPSRKVSGAVEIDVSGETYHALLGLHRTPVAGLDLTVGPDGWCELVTSGARAFFHDVELASNATLLVGDAISTTRGAAPVLRLVHT